MIHRYNKLLGQHFLTSPLVLEEIMRVAHVSPNDTILEIGAGTGVLTRKLAERAKHVISVEKDQRLYRELGEQLSEEGIRNVDLMQGDILKLAPKSLALPENFRVIANIPYYLTGRLVRLLLEGEMKPRDMLLMVQKEVALRTVARPPHMHMLAIAVQSYGVPKIEFFVPTSAFSPKPSVESAVVSISNIGAAFFKEHKVDPTLFFLIAKAGFQHRRKTLANSLAISLHLRANKVLETLKNAGIKGLERAETLSLEEWITVTKLFAASLKQKS